MGLTVGEEAVFTAIGDVEVNADGTVSMAELERVGVTKADIQEAAHADENSVSESKPLAAVAAAANPAYTRLATWKDNKAKTTTVRRGTSSFGYNHFSSKHNATINMARKTSQFPKTRTTSGSTIVYKTPANKLVCSIGLGCKITATITVREVVNNTRLSDGYQKGVITVVCEGYTLCPQWVIDVAN